MSRVLTSSQLSESYTQQLQPVLGHSTRKHVFLFSRRLQGHSFPSSAREAGGDAHVFGCLNKLFCLYGNIKT